MDRLKKMATPLKEAASSAIDANKEDLKDASVRLWNNPELAFKEFKAHDLLTEFLEKKGFEVERSYTGVKTAFRATFGSGRPNVCVICEYDALPEIGHACGHNLIAEAGLAAGLGVKAALESHENGLQGTVTVMGTPAEEEGGGKVDLLRNGAFKTVDIVMIVHPFPDTYICPVLNARWTLKVTYSGKAAHAAAYPWEGVNALDAAVMAYTSIGVLRQQMKPTWRVHSIISKGGVKPNIIPESSEVVTYVRAPTMPEVSLLMKKVTACFEAAAVATGCGASIEEIDKFHNVVQNSVIAKLYAANYHDLGETFEDAGDVNAGSDMGNVSYVVPSLHPNYAIGSGEVNHTREFTTVANTPASHEATLQAAKAMAHTAIDVLATPSLLEDIKKSFKAEISY